SRKSGSRSDSRGGSLWEWHVSSRHLLNRPFPSGFFGFAIRQHADRRIDGSARGHFRAAPKRGIAKFGIELLQGQAAHQFVSEQAAIDHVGIFTRLHHEFIEARRAREEYPGMLAELIGGI